MDKRAIESSHFKYFRNLMLSFPVGEVLHEDAPDFLVHTKKGLIGIEHCRLFQSPTEMCKESKERPLQARESEIDNILDIAKEQAELCGMPPVRATFIFQLDQYNTKALNKQERHNLGREIERAVNENLPKENESKTIHYPDTAKCGFPEKIVHAFLNRYGKDHIWTYVEAGESLSGCKCRKLIQQSIDEKVQKLPSYKDRKCLIECWLFIVANGLRPSGLFEINETERNHTYKSSFDRTYFLNYSDPEPLFCLKTENP